MNRLTELGDLNICSKLKLQPQHAHGTMVHGTWYNHTMVKTRFRRSGENDRCWSLRAYCNSGRSRGKRPCDGRIGFS